MIIKSCGCRVHIILKGVGGWRLYPHPFSPSGSYNRALHHGKEWSCMKWLIEIQMQIDEFLLSQMNKSMQSPTSAVYCILVNTITIRVRMLTRANWTEIVTESICRRPLSLLLMYGEAACTKRISKCSLHPDLRDMEIKWIFVKVGSLSFGLSRREGGKCLDDLMLYRTK